MTSSGRGYTLEQPEIGQACALQCPCCHDLGLAEEVALEVVAPEFSRLLVRRLGFDRFGYELWTVRGQAANMVDSRSGVALREIDLDDVRELDERLQFRTVGEIVESEQISEAFQVSAGFDDVRISVDRLKELDDSRVGRQRCGVAAEQEIACEIDKGLPISDQSREPKRQPCRLEDILRGFGRIAVRGRNFRDRPGTGARTRGRVCSRQRSVAGRRRDLARQRALRPTSPTERRTRSLSA